MTRRGFFENLFGCLPGSHAKADWDMDRRGFIGWILSILATIFTWPFTRAIDPKEALFSQALESDAGRQALAQAMVEPIRRQLDYEGFARKLLIVDELPPGAVARYQREVVAVARDLSNRGLAFQESIKEVERV